MSTRGADASLDDDSLEDVTRTSAGTPPPPPRRLLAPKVEVGDAIGRYLVLGTLGVGGMGVVHAAFDPELDRKLAIKLLRCAEFGTQHRVEIRARLLREAQAIAKLNHPNVVAVHDVGMHEGQVFVAMEFVDGGTLGEWMKQDDEPQPWRDVLARFVPAGRGLAAAHAAGLVHRDFKPANVLLGKDGRPRVADFGIARSIEDEGQTSELDAIVKVGDTGSSLNEMLATSGTLTRTGTVVGTPAYMAPEQFSDAHVDAQADQFGFCVALFEALYGRRPFKGQTVPAIVDAIVGGRIREPPRTSRVPTWLRKIVLRGLDPKPERRWPDMDALLQALERRPRRRGRTVAGISLTVAVLASAMAIGLGDHGAAPPVCTGAEDALDQTWSADRREAVAGNLAARSSPGAREAARHLLPRLDAWAGDWRAGWVDACEATRVRAVQSEELLDRRMSCLHRQRRRMDAYVELLREADDEEIHATLDGLDELVEDVGNPARCADTDALMAELAAPEDPRRRGQVEQLFAALDPVYAALAAGEWHRAEAELETLAPAVAEAEWLPLSAELAYLQGQVHHGGTRGDNDALALAEAAYREAFVAALKIDDEALAARARRDLAELIAEWDSRHDEALEHLRVAEALAEHLGDADLLGSVALTRASTLEQRGDFEAALASSRAAARELGEAHGARSARVAQARYRESMVLFRLGRMDEARATLDEARAGFGDDYGPHHPIALKLLNAEGVVALGSGDWAAAEAGFSALLERQQAVFGPDHLDVSDALANLGAAQYNAGKFEAARQSQERALAIREAQMGPDNLYVGHSLANLAVVYGHLGEHELAEQSARRAWAIIAEVRGAAHHDTMIAHSLVAEVVQLAGDDQAALVEFRAAQQLAIELGSPAQRLDLSLQVVTCLVHLGLRDAGSRELDRIEALAEHEDAVAGQQLLYAYLRARIARERGDDEAAGPHVVRARGLLDAARTGGVGALAEAEAWLAEHG